MKTEAFSEQMTAEGLTPEAEINDIMAKLPAIYYAGKGGYAIEHKGGFIPLPNETQVKQHLAMAGVTKELMTPIICRIRTENYVGYIGPVAGYMPGLHRSHDSGQAFLVTYGPTIIEGKKGETPFINRLLAGFVGGGLQGEALLAWWRQARRNVIACQRRPLPAAVFIGPPDGGKTLFLEISRVILGGRSASAFQYLAGRTQFNGDIIGAELTTVDDEIAHGDYKARTSFGQAIKRDHFASSVRLRKMYHEALVLRPVQTLAIAVNNEVEHLQVLPTVDNSLRDKLSLFWCGKADLEGMTDRAKIWKQIESELPALCYYLDSTDHPEILRHPRTGCAAWQSLEALEALQAISPEERLVELMGQCHEVTVAIEGDGDSTLKVRTKKSRDGDGWRGTSAALERELLDDDVTKRGADKLFRYDGACGSLLAKLKRSGRIDISSTTVRGTLTWTIKSLQPVSGSEEDPAAAYSVRGGGGGPKSDFYKQKGGEIDNVDKKSKPTPTTPTPKGGIVGEVPETVPTPSDPHPPRTMAVAAGVTAEQELRPQWEAAMRRLETITVVPEWFEDPAELYMDRSNLIVSVKLSAETLDEFYQRFLDLGSGVEECWNAVTGQTISASVFEISEPSVISSTISIDPENIFNDLRIEAAVDRLEVTLNAAN